MSSSGSSPARRALEEFVAGKIPADRLVATVAERFYGGAGTGEKEALRAVMEVVERAAPGVVSLERADGGAGFDVKSLERAFPPESIDALRGAAQAALAASWADPVAPAPEPSAASRTPDTGARSPVSGGLFSRFVAAVRRLFSASA